MRDFYQQNMYGMWREGEKVTYVMEEDKVTVTVEKDSKKTEFTVSVFCPEESHKLKFEKGSPFLICMHPIQPKDYALEQGYGVVFLDSIRIASDDYKHIGIFYELYPYGEKPEEQTGVLMAWAWGCSKVLDAMYAGLAKELSFDPEAAMVTGVSRWGKATAVCGAFDKRFRMTIPVCSGAGGLALNAYKSTGSTYDFRLIGGPKEYTYGENEPLSCLQSDGERGWFCDNYLQYKTPEEIPNDQYMLVDLAADENRYYFIVAACMGEDWVNAPAMWECYKKAKALYKEKGLEDHLAAHFHKEGHAVLQEDLELITKYFNKMYYGMDTMDSLDVVNQSIFAVPEILKKYEGRKDALQATYEFAKEMLIQNPDRGDMVYRYEHSLRVAYRGKQIAEGEGWQTEPLIMACLLHDVGYYQSFQTGEFHKHPEHSTVLAEQFLKTIEYDSETAKSICKAIAIHAVYYKDLDNDILKEATPFELSVRDADDIDRFDTMRGAMILRRDIGERTAKDLIAICEEAIRQAQLPNQRVCGSETARKLWMEVQEKSATWYCQLKEQMENTFVMEAFLEDKCEK